jgi:hypothetical protein
VKIPHKKSFSKQTKRPKIQKTQNQKNSKTPKKQKNTGLAFLNHCSTLYIVQNWKFIPEDLTPRAFPSSGQCTKFYSRRGVELMSS